MHSSCAASGHWALTPVSAALHGTQQAMQASTAHAQEAMRDFRSGKAQALVATDVAGRGLHIRNLPYVVNYGARPRLQSWRLASSASM